MKIGEIIEVEGVKYITQKEILACKWCCFDNQANIDCYKEFGCRAEDKVIFVKIPLELIRKIEQLEKQIEMMKNCDNCENIDIKNWNNCAGCIGISKWEMKK